MTNRPRQRLPSGKLGKRKTFANPSHAVISSKPPPVLKAVSKVTTAQHMLDKVAVRNPMAVLKKAISVPRLGEAKKTQNSTDA